MLGGVALIVVAEDLTEVVGDSLHHLAASDVTVSMKTVSARLSCVKLLLCSSMHIW